MIGWTYEANRDAIKQAQKDLDTFKDEDRLNDLEKAKEDELNELDEKIKNWEDYLTMLEYQYNEYERIERQRLLMEVTGAEDMRGVHEFLVDDMENFTDYVKNNQSAFLENAIKAYTDYNTAFGGFLDDYEKNQLRLYDLLGEQKELLNEEQFFKGNGTPLENFINNQLNSNWSDPTKELYDALTGAKYGDSPYSPGDTEQLAAAAAIKQREANGEKVQVIDQNGKYYNSLAEFEKAQATNSDLKIAAYKSDNSKQVGGGAINTNALYDTNTGQAVTTATGAAVSNALATDNGKTTYIKVGDKAVDASKYSSITLKGDGTAVLKDEKTGAEITGELIQLGSNDYSKVTNTTTGGTSMADLYAKYGDGSIYAIGENDQILRTATGSYKDGTLTYGGGTQKSGYEIAGGNNGVVDTNSYTDVTRSTTDYGEDYVYKTTAGSDIIKMLAKYEGGNVALVDDGNGGVKVVAGNKSTVNGDVYTTSGKTDYQIVGDATSTAALDAAISARTGGKADSSTLSSGGSNIVQMTEKYDNVAYVSDGNGGVRLVGGNNSTITTDKKTGKQYYTPAGSKKSYEIVSLVEKNGKAYANGIENGPVTYTGLAMLHGSPMNPEYVLNSAQAGKLLYNMATKDMAYESIIEKYATTNNTTGDAFNIGELNVQAESPQEFFDQLMQVVNGRYSTTKNRR